MGKEQLIERFEVRGLSKEDNVAKQVAIVMGSDSDLTVMNEASLILSKFKIKHDLRILSAHRCPELTAEFAKSARAKGIEVIIAGAGGAAHLAGVIAAHTILPVIGVPIETKALKGMDSLLSTVQMPSGIPVATMAIGVAGAKNAALMAVEILALSNKKLENSLKTHKKTLKANVQKKDRALCRKKRS